MPIHTIKTLEESLKYLPEDPGPNPLAIFDVDNTIVETLREFGGDQSFKNRLTTVTEMSGDFLTALWTVLPLWTAIQQLSQFKTPEATTSQFITQLAQQKWQIIGATARGLGTAGVLSKNLEQLEIYLKAHAPVKDNFFLPSTPHAIYFQGVIYAAGSNKGQRFKEFCQLANLDRPFSYVVFYDDNEKYLHQMADICQQMKIPFIGFRYAFLDQKIANLDTKADNLKWDRVEKFIDLILND